MKRHFLSLFLCIQVLNLIPKITCGSEYQHKIDTNRIKGFSSLKIKLTSLQINRFGLGWEREIKNSRSIEFECTYFEKVDHNDFHELVYDYSQIYPNINLKNNGVELRIGINEFSPREKKGRYFSRGIFIAYKYQHVSHLNWSSHGSDYEVIYNLSQTKNLLGVFGKLSTSKIYKSISFEHFLIFGLYGGFSRTIVFKVDDNRLDGNDRIQYPNTKFNPEYIYQPNGVTIIPSIKFGINMRLNLNRR